MRSIASGSLWGPDVFRTVHVAALALCAILLPWSTAFLSMAQMLLVANWLVEGIVRGDLPQRFGRAFGKAPSLVFVSFFGLHILGLAWSTDMDWGLDMVRILLPVLSFGVVLAASPRLSQTEYRTFFIWNGRQYIIIDAPGHKEFLKNMISGAARAEAALLLIDALEGVREQSKKHGYLLSLLGVTQFAVVVNKMDLVGYRQDVFDGIEKEYREFLGQFRAVPQQMIPVSAKMGDNIATRSSHMNWYQGPTVLETLALFKKEQVRSEQPLRFPLQDVYKFDARRILAGRITAGRLKVGDQLVFSPSNKTAIVQSIEGFNVDPPRGEAQAGQSVGCRC